jgi:serine protease AprX
MAQSNDGRSKRQRQRRTESPTRKTNAPQGSAPTDQPGSQGLLAMIGRGVVPPILHDRHRRSEFGLPTNDHDPGEYMIELNIEFLGGLHEASIAFEKLWDAESWSSRRPDPVPISKSYYRIVLNVNEWKELLTHDEKQANGETGRRIIYKLWPDFKVKALMDRSVATIKADAAYKSYSATGADITWAVIDSGIDGTHPHFGSADESENSVIHHPSVKELHYDFTRDGAPADGSAPDLPTEGETPEQAKERLERAKRLRARDGALTDDLGHGTHVAGIISGGLAAGSIPYPDRRENGKVRFAVFEQVFEADPHGDRVWGKQPVRRKLRHSEALRGVAPQCKLVSLKVLDGSGQGRVSDIMLALAYVRQQLNADPKILRVHGVNLSVGYDFDAQMFACGQSPVCVEVDRLVKSGVVVVTAAGNTGYGSVSAAERQTKVGLSNTINDPGNASLAITVGSTHRDAPHTYGVSFFSSKGPTGDGRLKPDLVAPGERITSCAAEKKRKKLGINVEDDVAAYVDDSGTSMAAPHVSGAIAAFLSIRREFVQRPEDVKRIFLQSATSLGRERYFEGHGLVDLMRAIQSV